MSPYLRRLAQAPGSMEPAGKRVALLTGQSSFSSSALSPPQLAFLEAVAPPGFEILRTGFPFDSSFDQPGFREAGLLAASWRNARQVYWSIYSREFIEIAALRLQRLVETSGRGLVLITGSCGLQLANAAWPLVRVPVRTRLQVVALGPVCLEPLRMSVTAVQGRRDIWSRALYRGPVDRVCECGHLDYWDSGEVRKTIAELLR